MLDSVLDLSLFGVVEAVKSTDKIAGDTADPLDLRAVLDDLSAALRAIIADDAGVAADGVAVDGMVDRAVADALFLHAANDLLECLEVLGGIAVELDVGDMTRVGQRVIRRLELDLIERVDGEVDRDMEGVGVILAVGHALDGAEALLVDADESAGQTEPLRSRRDACRSGRPALRQDR